MKFTITLASCLLLAACDLGGTYGLDESNAIQSGECHPECVGPNVECARNYIHDEWPDREPLCDVEVCLEGFSDPDLDFDNGCEANLFEQGSQYLGTIGADGAVVQIHEEQFQGLTQLSFYAQEESGSFLLHDMGFEAIIAYPAWARYSFSATVFGAENSCTLSSLEAKCFDSLCYQVISVKWPDRGNVDDSHSVLLDVRYDGRDASRFDHKYNVAAYNSFDIYLENTHENSGLVVQECW